MRYSRLRLKLSGAFAGVVLLVVAATDLGLWTWLRRDAERRFDRDLLTAAEGALAAVRREQNVEGLTLPAAVDDALAEWPDERDALIAVDGRGLELGRRGPQRVLTGGRATAAMDHAGGAPWSQGDGVQAARWIAVDGAAPPQLRILAGRSTHNLREFKEVVTDWLLFSVPGVVLFALVAGYLLAGRVLRPLGAMTAAIAGIAPENLGRRLPVNVPHDELDRLADQFNRLLERLAEARDRNRAFLARAAHQLKTPLTLVRGESALSLERARDAQEYRHVLERIGRAAEQMSHRVEELFLLAQAEAGERPPVRDAVELDAVVLECTDLMRRRAQASGHTLELDNVSADVVRGNDALLREALLELLENALKHGAAGGPIVVSARVEEGRAMMAVSSRGEPVQLPADDWGQRAEGRGLGLAIVQWIAEAHAGELQCLRDRDRNRFVITWPAHDAGHAVGADA